MIKNAGPKRISLDVTKCVRSVFTLTFAVEVVGIEVWHDCNEGWLELGPCVQGMKIQYQLFPGQSFDVDIMIWPHVAKIWSGAQNGWVRTWQLLERRWLTFSIRHAFPIRVVDFRLHTATASPSLGMTSFGASAKADKNLEAYLPPLKFGERRYFAPVCEQAEESMLQFIQHLIWNTVVSYIPGSVFDGVMDTPSPVTDVRFQDAVLYHVKETILNWRLPKEIEISIPEPEETKHRDRRESRIPKDKEKDKKKNLEVPKVKFEFSLTGDAILAGAGRIVPFEEVGDRPAEMGEIIVLIGTNNLPAQDDCPIFFVNIENLFDIPVAELKKLRITQLYTRWLLGEETHDSVPRPLKTNSSVKINDHHSIPLNYGAATEHIASLLENPFEIQIRGIRIPEKTDGRPKFFGYEKGDRDYGLVPPPKPKNSIQDCLIATTRIEAKTLSKGINDFLRGEYPLYPPTVTVAPINREGICTNDINGIRASLHPDLVVPPSVVLEAQMTLEASIGLTGCRPRRLTPCYSRLYCLIKDSDSTMTILRQITDINDELLASGKKNEVLTGFALDTGDIVIFFVEGPRDGQILTIWDMTEDFYSKVKPAFCSSSRYSTRIYPELLVAAMPFNVLKMYVPLGIILACPSVYARPALPLPTRSAVLKIGRLVSRKSNEIPSRSEMPTGVELKSFRLELCVAPRPIPVTVVEGAANRKVSVPGLQEHRPSLKPDQSSHINWDKVNLK